MGEKNDEKKLEESVRQFMEIVDQCRSKRFYLFNFGAGIARGIGFSLGATAIFGLILWSLSQLQIVPVVGDWIVEILDYINNAR